jgi:hypothetical protein
MRYILIILLVVLTACDNAHDATQCDQYLYSGVLDEHGEVYLDLNVDINAPLTLTGWALIDHTDYQSWEPLSVKIYTDGQVRALSHGGANTPYRLTLVECD